MTQPAAQPARAGRRWRLIPPLFLLAEVVVVIGLFQFIGWWTVVVLLGLSALGVVVISTNTRRSWRDIQTMRRTGEAPERTAGDTAFVVLAGVLLIFPGILSSVLGLLLLVPLTRTWLRRLVGVAASRTLLRTMGVRVHHGAGGSPFGDVVQGETSPRAQAQPQAYEQVPPAALEGKIVDKPTD
ncbi:FxsA family protein [Demetria terragena]|uniref:FxsA family protein n=1 Tax=Demetria terragena TaxID=63959 RepID=UPI00036CE057|nr:FxsA family protein [Demetria terragena]